MCDSSPQKEKIQASSGVKVRILVSIKIPLTLERRDSIESYCLLFSAIIGPRQGMQDGSLSLCPWVEDMAQRGEVLF